MPVHENQQILETVSVRHETSPHAPTRCGASGQRILGVLVQSTYAVAVEPDVIDFQIGVQKKLRWELLDCETDGVRGAGKSLVPIGLPPGPPARGGEQVWLAPGGQQFRFGSVIKSGHFPESRSPPASNDIAYRRQRGGPQGGPGLIVGEPASDLAALQHGVDVALSLSLLEDVPGHDLGHEIIPCS